MIPSSRRARPLPIWLFGPFAALLLLTTPLAAQNQWYSVHLDGRKIGHMATERSSVDGQVLTRRTLELTLERNGEPLQVRSEEQTTETDDGKPLGFVSHMDLAGSRSRHVGTVREGEFTLRTELPGQPATETSSRWPAGALLSEGQRLALQRIGRDAGATLEMVGYDPSTQRTQRLRWTLLGEQPIELHGTRETLIAARQESIADDADGQAVELWLHPADLAVRRMRVPALGLMLEVVACDRDCALAPSTPTDVLAATLVASPRPLSDRERSGPLGYRLQLGPEHALALGALPGQRIEHHADGHVTVWVDPGNSPQPAPVDADLAPTRWLQSDADDIVAMARDVMGRGRQPAEQMVRLEQRVREHIANKSLRIGYASALETLRLREGDCTEHAVLLAALARAAGIPARVATGLAYTPGFGGRRDVFVPHAWVFAWIDGRWQGFDAALPRYDNGHIAFSVDHGDPYRFYRGLELLGGLVIDAVDRPVPATDPVSPDNGQAISP